MAILLGSKGTKGGHFLAKKMLEFAPLVPSRPHKMSKTQNIKNQKGADTFSVEKKGTNSRRGKHAKW